MLQQGRLQPAALLKPVLVAAVLLIGCATSSSSSVASPAAEVVATVTTERGVVDANEEAPVLAAEPTASPPPSVTPAPTPEPTSTPELTATPEPAPEPTSGPEPTVTAEPTPEPTVMPEPTVIPELPEPSVAAAPLTTPWPPASYDGEVRAIRTTGGHVMAVRGADNGTYQVVTPCFAETSIGQGLPLTGPLDVLIDPGHGGDEPGAVGPNGLREATVNLQVAELLRSELSERGYTSELTRYADHRVAIQSRAELANALQPRVFLSIHHNGGFPEPFPVAGTEVFIQQGDPESARLGGLIFEEIQAAFADIEADWMGNEETFGVAWRQNSQGTDLYGILRRTPELVTVLSEAMFVSTEAEAELLTDPAILEAEAVALANALERFFETQDPGSGFIDGLVFRGDLGPGGGTDGCVDPTFN